MDPGKWRGSKIMEGVWNFGGTAEHFGDNVLMEEQIRRMKNDGRMCVDPGKCRDLGKMDGP